MSDQEQETTFRSGFVGVLGLPNAGKSTLVNALLNRSICITSFKPQTTRLHVRCIATSPERQIVFVDTPGWVPSQQKLDKLMRKEIYRGVDGVDVLVFMIDATRLEIEKNRECWKALVGPSKAKRLLVLNKIDKYPRVQLIPKLELVHKTFQPDELIPLSATKKTNLEELDKVLTSFLPKGPRYYPDDTVVDRPLSFVLSEFVREQLYLGVREEVPFATAVIVDELVDEEKAVTMTASIVTEKDSQKGIIIGAGGAMIKEIREKATRRMKQFFGPGKKVKLELTVRVKRNWRKDTEMLRGLGFE